MKESFINLLYILYSEVSTLYKMFSVTCSWQLNALDERLDEGDINFSNTLNLFHRM